MNWWLTTDRSPSATSAPHRVPWVYSEPGFRQSVRPRSRPPSTRGRVRAGRAAAAALDEVADGGRADRRQLRLAALHPDAQVGRRARAPGRARCRTAVGAARRSGSAGPRPPRTSRRSARAARLVELARRVPRRDVRVPGRDHLVARRETERSGPRRTRRRPSRASGASISQKSSLPGVTKQRIPVPRKALLRELIQRVDAFDHHRCERRSRGGPRPRARAARRARRRPGTGRCRGSAARARPAPRR